MKRQVSICLGALGDFLLTLPLLRELHPVAVLSRAAYRALLPDWLEDAPFLPIDGALGSRLFTPEATFPPALAEVVADADIQTFSRPDEFLGRNLLRHGAQRLVWHDPRPTTPPHVVVRYFANAEIPLPPDWLTTPVMPTDQPGDTLWIHPGSGSPAKSLPLPLLVQHASEWHRETGQPVVVSFGEADLALRAPLRTVFGEAGIGYEEAICPPLGELRAQLASRARRFLGADTGVTHLAAALGKDVTVGFRTTDPAIWRPIGHCRTITAG